jgi:hypothetical protein
MLKLFLFTYFRSFVINPDWTSSLKYYASNRHTSGVENFNLHILIRYCPTRLSFGMTATYAETSWQSWTIMSTMSEHTLTVFRAKFIWFLYDFLPVSKSKTLSKATCLAILNTVGAASLVTSRLYVFAKAAINVHQIDSFSCETGSDKSFCSLQISTYAERTRS